MSDDTPQYLSSERRGDTVVFRILIPQLRDAETSYALRDAMLAELTNAPTQKVVIDLGRVDFIGSVGFLAFLNTRRQIADGRIVFCHVSPYVLEAFRACRLVTDDAAHPGPFEVQESEAAAVASLRA